MKTREIDNNVFMDSIVYELNPATFINLNK